MSYVRKTTILASISILTALAAATSSSANPAYHGQSYGTSFDNSSSHNYGVTDVTTRGRIGVYFSDSRRNLPNASETASFYYRVGVKHFKKADFKESERAFQAVLRAKGLNQEAYRYLSMINQKQGNKEAALKYAKAYHGINN